MHNGAFELAVAPQAEGVSAGVDEVQQRLQLVPLSLVMWIFEATGIWTLAGSLDFDESHRVTNRECEVRAGLEISK